MKPLLLLWLLLVALLTASCNCQTYMCSCNQDFLKEEEHAVFNNRSIDVNMSGFLFALFQVPMVPFADTNKA